MHHSLSRGPSEPISPRAIAVLVITNDPEQARLMMDALGQTSYAYIISELSALDTLEQDLRAAIEDVRAKMPLIVMIDYEFVLDACETIVGQIGELKGGMAVECLVTRPPAGMALCERLQDEGVFLFDVGGELSTSVLEIH